MSAVIVAVANILSWLEQVSVFGKKMYNMNNTWSKL